MPKRGDIFKLEVRFSNNDTVLWKYVVLMRTPQRLEAQITFVVASTDRQPDRPEKEFEVKFPHGSYGCWDDHTLIDCRWVFNGLYTDLASGAYHDSLTPPDMEYLADTVFDALSK